MYPLYIVTGANGHLGSTIVRLLVGKGCRVRGLIMPHETPVEYENVEYIMGDVRDADSLEALFCNLNESFVVIHTAGIIDISDTVTSLLYDVNVTGTKNVVEQCIKHGAARLVYVSSVHAIPEKKGLRVLSETDSFSPDLVVGGYAKTKAEASQFVLDAVRKKRLDAVVVHPSGILGPYDNSGNHLVQLVEDYISGKLPACVRGGYDLVDVRDVAQGCIDAAEKGVCGECYILSGRHYEIKELLSIAKETVGGKKLPTLPVWMARAVLPILALDARRKKSRPLYTKYSLHTLESNDNFSHDKATRNFGYSPRDLNQTVADMVEWAKMKRRGKARNH